MLPYGEMWFRFDNGYVVKWDSRTTFTVYLNGVEKGFFRSYGKPENAYNPTIEEARAIAAESINQKPQ